MAECNQWRQRTLAVEHDQQGRKRLEGGDKCGYWLCIIQVNKQLHSKRPHDGHSSGTENVSRSVAGLALALGLRQTSAPGSKSVAGVNSSYG